MGFWWDDVADRVQQGIDARITLLEHIDNLLRHPHVDRGGVGGGSGHCEASPFLAMRAA